MSESERSSCKPIEVWGLPLMPYTIGDALDHVARIVASGKPGYIITANLHYAMLCDTDPRLGAVNERAAFIVADGMPLVWASKLMGTPLPERVAGSDLIWKVCERAARDKQRIFILGGAPGVAEAAGQKLVQLYPGLVLAGSYSPPYRPLTDAEEADLIERLNASSAHILILAFGQPNGELWIARNCERIKIPACIQLGASIDFVVGKVKRAPRWMQRMGLEWFFRLIQEPRRLIRRYARNIRFLIRMIFSRTRRRTVRRDATVGDR